MIKRAVSIFCILVLMMSMLSVVASAEDAFDYEDEYYELQNDAAIETVDEYDENELASTGVVYDISETEKIISYPEITGFDTVLDGTKVMWKSVDGAYKYRLYIKNGSSWKSIAETTNTSYNHTDLQNNKTYTYTLRAFDKNGQGIGSFYKTGWDRTFLTQPKLTSVAPAATGMKVTWGAVSGATKYKVYVKNSSSWKALGFTINTSFVDTNVTSGKSYTYTVRCVSYDESEFTSHFDRSGKTGLFVGMPKITSVEAASNGTKVSWTKCDGAYKYRLFIKNGTSWKGVGDTTSNSLTHTGVKINQEYTYTVRALNKNGAYVSAYDSNGVKHKRLSIPAISSVSPATSGMKISWGAVSGASKYKVYAKSGSSWKALGITKDTSFIDKGVTSGKSYTYTVRCVSADEKTFTSYYDTKGKTAMFVATPTVQKLENLKDGTKVSWTKCDGAYQYRLFIKSGSSWKTIATTTSTTATYSGLKNNDTYTYTVRALDKNGAYVSAYNSTGWEYRFIAPPVINSVTSDVSGVVLSWNDVSDVYGYRLYRKTLGGDWKCLANITDNIYTDTTAPADMPYCYTLRCIDENATLLSYFIADTQYYCNGALADGIITVNDKEYSFVDGHLKQGFVTINDNTYYYNSKGELMKNCIVGSSKEGYNYADENGICATSQELKMAAEFVAKYGTGNTAAEKMKKAYLALSKNYPYSRAYDHPKKASDLGPLAVDMFTNHKGNCFRYAASFACIAKVCGYKVRVGVGSTVAAAGGWTPHGWTEVYYDGKWRYCDPDGELYNLPDYAFYMQTTHPWTVKADFKAELTVSNGKAVWK